MRKLPIRKIALRICKKIASDENQTVKAVKEAQLKLEETSNELNKLKNELSAVQYRGGRPEGYNS